MKNTKAIILGGAALTALTAGIYSFTSDNNPTNPEMKNYEVVRMVNGKMTTFDTTVAANSTYTAQNYLADLGFDNDPEINIIDLTHSGSGANEFTFSSDGHGDGEVVIIEMDENVEDVHTTTNPDGTQEIRIEKKIIKTSENGEEDVNVEVEIDGILENINIDSLIAIAMKGHEGDSGQVFVKKMIISDEHIEGDGNGDVQWESIDATNADYHNEVNGPNHHMEVAVWGDGGDFTLLIVTDPATAPSNKSMVVTEGDKKAPMFKMYPNPAEQTAQLELNFEDIAPTTINITDMRGATVAKMELGDFAGQFNHKIDVTKWQNGVYIVQVDHGNEKIIEKLIVE
ncbi:MAG: T9SS type A sorting domain-containing protein [Crocinitomicaceae bacterium]